MPVDPKLRRALTTKIENHDRTGALAAAEEALDGGSTTISDLYETLSELLIDVGSMWQKGAAEVWQEHLATGIVRTIVESLAARVEASAPVSSGSVVILAAPEEEYHDLGLRMLADRFTLAGWRAHFLGADLPVSEVISAVEVLSADALALSASTHFHRLSLRQYVDAVQMAHPDVRIWVGGPAFAYEHDGWPAEMVLDPLAVPSPEEV